jgi:nickel-dependent lactate racemase
MTERALAGSIIALAYGRGSLNIALPIDADIIRPRHGAALLDPADAVRSAIRKPPSGLPLAAMVSAGARVGVSVCDVTRPFPSHLVLPILLDELAGAQVTVFVATGTHRGCTDEELDAMLGPEIRTRVTVIQHDAFDAAAHQPVCPIPGSDVVAAVDSRFLDQDVRVTLGFIEPHFFAGFSGGPKMVAPGLASIETVLELHSAARLADPRATFGVVDGNPVHEGIAAVAAAVGVDFALDVTLDDQHRITGIYAGKPFEAYARGCDRVRATSMTRVALPYDIVVTTNSGYPLDQNLYQGGKGLSAAAGILREGGAILFVSECADGVPAGSAYASSLDRFHDPEDLLGALLQGGVREPEQWAGQKAALVRRRGRVFMHSRGLTDAEVRAAWFEPVDDPTACLEALVAEYGPSCRVAVLPEGPQSIAYLA